jgi:hypothetical protein
MWCYYNRGEYTMARLVEKVTSGTIFPFNTYFFAIKWARFRMTSILLEKDQNKKKG